MTGEDDIPTVPDLPTSELRCPECGGNGMVLVVLLRNADGTASKGIASTCSLCEGTGEVSRHTFAEWHATREGRPPG